MGPCVTNWYFTDWSKAVSNMHPPERKSNYRSPPPTLNPDTIFHFAPQCSAQCGPGVQKREVVCLTRGGIREGEGGGDCVGDKPAEMKACNGGPCVPRSMWYSSPWTEVGGRGRLECNTRNREVNFFCSLFFCSKYVRI